MGNAAEVFRWPFIGPRETVGVFIHPYGIREFAAFSINVALRSNQPSGAYTAIAAQQTDGVTQIHVDGQARTIWVENKTVGPQPFISVGLVEFTQSF
jgi:hypothetical protein